MNLRRKLQRLKQQSSTDSPPVVPSSDAALPVPSAPGSSTPVASDQESKAARIERLRSMMQRMKETPPRSSRTVSTESGSPKWDHLPGKEVQTEQGSYHLIEQLLEPDHHHGKVPVQGALQVSMQTVAKLALDPTLESTDIERALIFDTETTGLAGGTGTVPFLVGLAWFEDGVLRVEQLLLRSLNQEVPLLQRVRDRLSASSLLISYNGKSYDWPLLRTRFVMNRVAVPNIPPHLDLLHCARRVLKLRMKDVRLTEVEQKLLGFYREGDVDGSLIPDIYFRFLRGADSRTLLPIIEHNANDVIALAAILGRLAKHFESVQSSDDPRDHLAYAKVAVRAKDHERAVQFAEAAVEGCGSQDVAVDALLLTAKLARRAGDTEASIQALLKALAASSDEEVSAQIHLALAKLYEHKVKDYERAREHALKTSEAEGEPQHIKRLARIEKRLGPLGRE